MSDLRELLQQVSEHPNDYFHRYRLFDALIEELEAQRPPQVDARIAKLTAERDSWERQCRNAERRLAEAKTEIKRLTLAYAGANERIGALRTMLVEAQAEIRVWERRWKERDKAVERRLAEARAEIERLKIEIQPRRKQTVNPYDTIWMRLRE